MIQPILVSLKVASLALILIIAASLVLVRLFTEKEFRGKDTLETLIMLPMVLPPTILGYGLLLLFGRHGFLGKPLFALFDASLIFTWGAAVLAAFIVGLPLMYQSLKGAITAIDEQYIQAARTMGLEEKRIFWRIKLPLARQGFISGLALALARALGEFGATLMVAGNIPGKTQTVPIAIYFAVEAGRYREANILLGFMLLSSLGLIYFITSKRSGRRTC
jgi:molybdate transport system permease protein